MCDNFCKKKKKNLTIEKYFVLCKTLGWENVLMYYIKIPQSLSSFGYREKLRLALKELELGIARMEEGHGGWGKEPGSEKQLTFRSFPSVIRSFSSPSLHSVTLILPGSLGDTLMRNTSHLPSCGFQTSEGHQIIRSSKWGLVGVGRQEQSKNRCELCPQLWQGWEGTFQVAMK